MAHDREAEAQPAVVAGVGGIALAEALEDVGKDLRADALAGVLDGDHHVGIDPLDARGDAPAPGRELDRVRDQVPDHLPQAVGVAGHQAGRGIEDGLYLDPTRVRRRHQRLDGRRHHGRHLDGAHVQAELRPHDARQVEDVRDHLLLRAGVAVDGVEGAGLGGLVQASASQQVDPPDDGGERRPQLVGQGGQELVLDAAGCLRLLAGVIGLGQQPLALALRPLALGDVAGESAEAIVRVLGDDRDRHLEGEGRPVAAAADHLRALRGTAAGRVRARHVLAQPLAVGFVDDQADHAGADRLVPSPAEGVLCAGVPEADHAVRVHGHDRVQGVVEDGAHMGGARLAAFLDVPPGSAAHPCDLNPLSPREQVRRVHGSLVP